MNLLICLHLSLCFRFLHHHQFTCNLNRTQWRASSCNAIPHQATLDNFLQAGFDKSSSTRSHPEALIIKRRETKQSSQDFLDEFRLIIYYPRKAVKCMQKIRFSVCLFVCSFDESENVICWKFCFRLTRPSLCRFSASFRYSRMRSLIQKWFPDGKLHCFSTYTAESWRHWWASPFSLRRAFLNFSPAKPVSKCLPICN